MAWTSGHDVSCTASPRALQRSLGGTWLEYACGQQWPLDEQLLTLVGSQQQAPQTCAEMQALLGQHGLVEKRELELAFGTEPIVGWRAWKIAAYSLRDGRVEPRLAAISDRAIWPAGRRYEATCKPGGLYPSRGWHETPWPDCQCGVWALHTREAAEAKAGTDGCFGPVHLWGRVLEFEHGYRAQYAYPKALYFWRRSDGLPAELERLYGVPSYVLASDPRPNPTVRLSFQIDASKLSSLGVSFAEASKAMASIGRALSDSEKGGKALVQLGDVTPRFAPPRERPTLRDALRSKTSPPR